MAFDKHITLTYLNIRESIAILLTKIVLIDVLLAGAVIGFYFALVQGDQYVGGLSQNTPLFLSVFGLLGAFKIIVTSYVVLEWLNEYYEITPEYISHKYGIIFKKQEHYRIDTVRRIEVHDSFLGEVFNFGTIVLYDVRLNKYLDMYLIHNPRRYAKVIKEIKPTIEVKEDHVWLPMQKDEDIITSEES